LNPDRIFLIPPNTACATSVSNPVSQLYMHFVLGLDRATWPGAIFVHHLKPGERRLIDRLVTALLRRSDNRALEISFLSHALVNTALAAVPAAQWEGRLPEARIDQALRSIKASAPDPVTNERLAEEAGINVNAFTKLFLKATGQTPRQYLIQLRIEKACRLLEQNTMAIDQIAETSGFCDRYHFSRIFKKRVGVSPAAFRRRSRD